MSCNGLQTSIYSDVNSCHCTCLYRCSGAKCEKSAIGYDGPNCVYACPHDAAIRVNPVDFLGDPDRRGPLG